MLFSVMCPLSERSDNPTTVSASPAAVGAALASVVMVKSRSDDVAGHARKTTPVAPGAATVVCSRRPTPQLRVHDVPVTVQPATRLIPFMKFAPTVTASA